MKNLAASVKVQDRKARAIVRIEILRSVGTIGILENPQFCSGVQVDLIIAVGEMYNEGTHLG